jgi:hypothetical protein
MARYAALVGVTDHKLEIKELFAESVGRRGCMIDGATLGSNPRVLIRRLEVESFPSSFPRRRESRLPWFSREPDPAFTGMTHSFRLKARDLNHPRQDTKKPEAICFPPHPHGPTQGDNGHR